MYLMRILPVKNRVMNINIYFVSILILNIAVNGIQYIVVAPAEENRSFNFFIEKIGFPGDDDFDTATFLAELSHVSNVRHF